MLQQSVIGKGKIYYYRLPNMIILVGSILTGLVETKKADAMCLPQPVDSMKAMAHGNNLYLLWEGDTYYFGDYGSHMGNHTLYFKKGTDGGITFSNPVALAHGSYATNGISPIDPDIVSAGSNVYVTWIVGTNSPKDQIAFAKATIMATHLACL